MDEERPADLAGKWYPAEREACEAFLQGVQIHNAPPLSSAYGAIVPHAGWPYSGSIAFHTLKQLEILGQAPKLVIVFGGHLEARDQPRIFLSGQWQTPYGPLPIEAALSEDIAMSIESETETPLEYYDDNAVEVLMPMVKKLWPQTQVVVFGVPPTRHASRIGAEIVSLAHRRHNERILVIGSTDLTHYGPNYRFSPAGRGHRALEWVKTKNDPEFISQAQNLDPTKMVWVAERFRNACCAGAAAATVAAVKKLGANKAVVIDYATSWDIAPEGNEPTSFVGYVGITLGRDAPRRPV